VAKMSNSVEQPPHLKLKRVNLLVSKSCNLHCRMCDYPEFYPENQEMPFGQIRQIINEIKILGAEVLELSGGEPMIRTDIYEIISYAKSLGLNVVMVTNGVLIGPLEVEKLIKAGITFVSISMEGPEPVHDHIRGPGNFKKALHAIQNFIHYNSGKRDLQVAVGVTLSKYNYQLIAPFSRYLLEEIGVNSISINPFSNDMFIGENRKFRPREFQITPDLIPDLTCQINKLIEYSKHTPYKLPAPGFLKRIPDYFLGQKLIPPGGCFLPSIFCGISANGLVHACWKNPPIGNLREMNLIEILRSSNYREFRKRALTGKCNGCLSSCFAEIYANS
jgi:MoaA/NifB/PqqE/SkfB family radical SAM enzyme